MIHPDDDMLLQLALELLDDPERQAVREHVTVCPDCQLRYRRQQEQISLLSSVSAGSGGFRIERPRMKPKRLPVMYKIAAVLLLGIMTGWGTGRVLFPPIIEVTAAQVTPHLPVDSTGRVTAASDATALSAPTPASRLHSGGDSL